MVEPPVTKAPGKLQRIIGDLVGLRKDSLGFQQLQAADPFEAVLPVQAEQGSEGAPLAALTGELTPLLMIRHFCMQAIDVWHRGMRGYCVHLPEELNSQLLEAWLQRAVLEVGTPRKF